MDAREQLLQILAERIADQRAPPAAPRARPCPRRWLALPVLITLGVLANYTAAPAQHHASINATGAICIDGGVDRARLTPAFQ